MTDKQIIIIILTSYRIWLKIIIIKKIISILRNIIMPREIFHNSNIRIKGHKKHKNKQIIKLILQIQI
jgi:hypothetical protein